MMLFCWFVCVAVGYDVAEVVNGGQSPLSCGFEEVYDGQRRSTATYGGQRRSLPNPTPLLALLCFLLILLTHIDLSSASADEGLKFSIAADAQEWSTRIMSSPYDEFDDGGLRLGLGQEAEELIGGEEGERRSLFWRAARYFISYGALSANRVPCPPRSGRSYYTHNRYRARGPIRPYVRGCSAISCCRRW